MARKILLCVILIGLLSCARQPIKESDRVIYLDSDKWKFTTVHVGVTDSVFLNGMFVGTMECKCKRKQGYSFGVK